MLDRRVLAAGALLLLSTAALATPAPPADRRPDPEAAGLGASARLTALVERVKWEQERLETLEAEFDQERASEFLVKAEAAHGRFSYAAPDRVRWEYLEPKPISLVIHDDEMLTWYRDVGRAERMKVGRVSTQVFRYLNATGSLESLLGYFAVTYAPPAPEEPYRLELTPRYKRIGKRLASMTIWIDRAFYLPVRVRYVEPNGDTTDYRFRNLRPNVPIPNARFDLALPNGVAVKVLDLDRGRIAAE